MCGIAGWLGDVKVDRSSSDRILEELHHRGPDAQGRADGDGWGLLHTRLSIIDRSHAADQPFRSEDGSVAVVFNGEIYNHRDLRRELEAAGHRFHTHCDTENIPALYREEGTRFAERLRGMFAIALYDERNRELHLVRDRFGIKPLFMAATPRAVFFASELGAIQIFPGIGANVDPQAVADFVTLHVIPGPSTLYAGIENVCPGELVTIVLDDRRPSIRRRRFHNWRIAPDRTLTLARATEEAAYLLNSAVSSQLESDVPLGALLSGGIDSSLVSAAARSSLPDLRTFSVRFDDPAFDESAAAQWVADHLATTHEVLRFEDADPSWESLTATLRTTGQPFADTSLFAVDALARLVRHRVTVALSGDGGDEGFGGYDHYLRVPKLAFAFGSIPAWGRRALLPAAGPVASIAARAHLIPRQLPGRVRDFGSAADFPGVLANLTSWIRPREFDRLWVGPPVEPPRRHFLPQWEHDLGRRDTPLERLTALTVECDTRVRMANDYLPKVDTASMRWSLEVRVPMLDEELFALGLRLPFSLRAGGGVAKRVLRGVAGKTLGGIADLPKRGFGVPVDRWMPPALRARLRDEVTNPVGPVREFVSGEWMETTLGDFVHGGAPSGLTRQGLYQRAIMLLALHLYLTDT